MSSLRVKKTASKPEIADQIGRQLRSVYNDVLAQPIPDRFLDLLKGLDDPASSPRAVSAPVDFSLQMDEEKTAK